MAKRAREQDLPGMEDRAIRSLQNCAHEYAEIRDARIELNQREAKLKKKILRLMHEHEKTHYLFDDVEIDIEPPDGQEKVTVKIKKPRQKSAASGEAPARGPEETSLDDKDEQGADELADEQAGAN